MTFIKALLENTKHYVRENSTELLITGSSEAVKIGLTRWLEGEKAANQLRDQNYNAHSKLASPEDIAKIAVTLIFDRFSNKRDYYLSPWFYTFDSVKEYPVSTRVFCINLKVPRKWIFECNIIRELKILLIESIKYIEQQ